MDLAASVQKVTEEIVLRITRNLATTYQIENLCLAGGVALNCVANGKILRDGSFKRFGSSQRRVMQVALWAQRSLPITSTLVARADEWGLRWDARLLSRPGVFRDRDRGEDSRQRAQSSPSSTNRNSLKQPAMRWKRAMPSVGSRAAWSLGRALSAPARFWGSAQPQDAEDAQSKGQVSRELPSVRSFSPA